MSHEHHNPLEHPDVQVASAPRYIAAFVVALGLMVAAALITEFADLSLMGVLIELSIIGFVAIVIQLYLLFKLDIAKSRIWHTVSFVLTVPLLFIAISLTQWMFHNLAVRTALGG